MKIVLLYKGRLNSNGDKNDKGKIRDQVHPQIKKCWDKWPLSVHKGSYLDTTKDSHCIRVIGGNIFSPLVTSSLQITCSLSIHLLIPRQRSSLLNANGDLDNRIKTLIDGLRMPKNINEIHDNFECPISPYCTLLEDDSLVTEISIKSDELLLDEEEKGYVMAVITAEIQQIGGVFA